MKKYTSSKKLILTILSAVLLCCSVLGYSLFGDKNATALNPVPTTTTIGEIYDYDTYCYSAENLDALSRRILGILGQSGTKLSDLITYARNNAGENGVAIKGTAITLQYGRYRFSADSTEKKLAWMPVYLSRSTSGDAILTLYLAATEAENKSTSQQEAGHFSHDGNYSVNALNEAPTDMYGTSFIRAVSLGNGGKYAMYGSKGNNSTIPTTQTATIRTTNYNKFSDFIKMVDNQNGNKEVFGLLYDDIATPSELKWQSNESYAAYIGTPNSGDRYMGKIFPNEAYGTPSTGTYTNESYNYANGTYMKDGYDLWKNDKVWLPSLTEVGTGDIVFTEGSSIDTTNGIWKLTANQRSNTTYSWLRTADTTSDAAHMFVLDKDGNVSTSLPDPDYGIRPAIHLNLSKITAGNKTVAPINIPDVVTWVYNGEYMQIDDLSEDLRKQYFPWYSADDMRVTFAYNEEFSLGTVPLNAGEYWMRVELKASSNRYFLGSTQKGESRKFKFVVQKAKLGIKWVYENTTQLAPPTELQVYGKIYDRDIRANNVPEVGMLYSNATGAGDKDIPYWPEHIGYYIAKAAIVDEKLHSYNYELASEIEVDVDGQKVKTDKLESHQFEVLPHEVEVPVFKDYPTQQELTLTYKGRQYIQLSNVSKYVDIKITANTDKAQSNIQDLGIVDGVQTFALETVGSYEFSITLKNEYKLDTIWKGEGTNNSYHTLTLNIDKAELELVFENLSSSWQSVLAQEFSVNLLGVFTTGSSNDKIEVGVRWQGEDYNQGDVTYNEQTGKFVIPANFFDSYFTRYNRNEVYFTMEAYVKNIDSLENYMLDRNITQKFSVTKVEISFNANTSIQWHYKLSGDAGYKQENIAYNACDSQSKALELPFVDNGFYEFSLMTSADVFKNMFLKVEYSGDLHVNAAGMHSVTVRVSAYYDSINFTPKEYSIYFYITPAKFDLSNTRWDYSTPFTYTGSEQKVKIDPNTLPDGLTVVYTTDGKAGNSAIDAGNYVTTVTFKVSESKAANFTVPVAANADSFSGSFSFTCNWSISKKNIEAEWNAEPATSDLFFVPTLVTGSNLVNYTYERLVNGSWTSCSSITSTNSDEQYRVTAAIKPEYEKNYSLSGNTSREFTVAAGRHAVSLYYEVNGVRRDDGTELYYTGEPFEVRPVSSSADLTIGSCTVVYYNATATGALGTQLSGAPSNTGSYIAVVNTIFTAGGYDSETQFSFKIVNNDLDLSSLRLVYEHGNTRISASWDSDLQKWVDAGGREATFSFEYDGTEHRINIEGYENIAGLTISGVSGNSSINAGAKKMYIEFSCESGYNEPALPEVIDWEIRKAAVNFEDVKWGYIDDKGNEYAFGNGVEPKFVFTRDSDKNSVKFTVALINLPSYLEAEYSTMSYTDNHFGNQDGKQDGNSFSAVGRYYTELFRIKNYNGDANHESFTFTNFPENIPKFIDWEIEDRELDTPEYDNSWVKFDNKVHDLLAMSGISRDQLNYFEVEVTYLAGNNALYNNYSGFDDVPFAARDAGRYTVTFYKLLVEWDGSGYNDKAKYAWGQVEIDVAKAELSVTWDEKGVIPVAMVKGIYVFDMIGTMYYIIKEDDKGVAIRGAAVSVEYIKTTGGEVTFEAEPYLLEEYTNNLTLVMADNEKPVIRFTYSPFIRNGSTVPLAYPTMTTSKVEYTGNTYTFAIYNWNLYKDYLYILEGEDALKQKDAGVYHITVGFIKTANACWKDADEDSIRSTYVLEFEITPLQKVGLEYPEFDRYSAPYTGSSIKFEITNWVALKDYVDFTVTFKGQVLPVDEFNFTEAGTYTITFTFKDVIPRGYWVEDPDKQELVVQVKIIGEDGDDTTVLTPAFRPSSQQYTGSELSFTIYNWNEIKNFVTITGVTSGVTYSNGVFKATEAKTYEVVISTIAGFTFADGSTSIKITFTITPPDKPAVTDRYPVPTLIQESKGVYRISNWSSLKDNVTVKVIYVNDGSEISISSDGVITATAPGVYSIVITLNSDDKIWENGESSVELSFVLLADDGPTYLPDPFILIDEKEYTGYEIYFEIGEWAALKEYIAIASGSLTQTAVGEYSVIIQLRDPNKTQWMNGDPLTARTISFRIVPANITITTDGDGKPKATNGDGKDVDLDDYLEPHYYDPSTGKEVPADELEKGKEYDVRYDIKNESEFNKNIANSSEIKEYFSNSETVFHITWLDPNPEPKAEDQTLMIITLVEVGILVILTIATIVVLATKRHEYEDDSVDNYDDDDD